MFNLDISELNDKQERIAGVKVMQIQHIVREDMNMSFKDLCDKYRDEMGLITAAIQSIVVKETGQGQDK